LKPFGSGTWIKVTFCYNGASREVGLYLNDRLIRQELSLILPSVDRPMPVWLGGINSNGQRFRGKIRKLVLGNLLER